MFVFQRQTQITILKVPGSGDSSDALSTDRRSFKHSVCLCRGREENHTCSECNLTGYREQGSLQESKTATVENGILQMFYHKQPYPLVRKLYDSSGVSNPIQRSPFLGFQSERIL